MKYLRRFGIGSSAATPASSIWGCIWRCGAADDKARFGRATPDGPTDRAWPLDEMAWLARCPVACRWRRAVRLRLWLAPDRSARTAPVSGIQTTRTPQTNIWQRTAKKPALSWVSWSAGPLYRRAVAPYFPGQSVSRSATAYLGSKWTISGLSRLTKTGTAHGSDWRPPRTGTRNRTRESARFDLSASNILLMSWSRTCDAAWLRDGQKKRSGPAHGNYGRSKAVRPAETWTFGCRQNGNFENREPLSPTEEAGVASVCSVGDKRSRNRGPERVLGPSPRRNSASAVTRPCPCVPTQTAA